MKLEKDLSKLGIQNTRDLLFYFPYRYEDFSNLSAIADLRAGEAVSIKGRIIQIKAVNAFYGRIRRAEAVISDESGSIKAVWFNQPYIVKYLSAGDEVFLSGTAREYKGELQLQSPIYEKAEGQAGAEASAGKAEIAASAGKVGVAVSGKDNIHTARIIPIYRLTGNLSLRALRAAMHDALGQADSIEEYLPAEMIKDAELADIQTTIKNLHFPESQQALDLAKKRIAFEEIFYAQLAVQKHKREMEREHAPQINFKKDLVSGYISKLSFELTADQKKALWEILQDLGQGQPMNRLLQGDVGSGKTLVAFIAALCAMDSGFQVAMLCPTEVLAQQHYANAQKYFKDYPRFSLMLLTSKKSQINGRASGKAELLKEIEHGGPQFIISTHAVLEEKVSFREIGLVIIDEQHRFGVRQRALLKQKQREIHPHLLSMSATPIPRTLRLSLFGDLKVSEICHLPAGRKTIVTRLVRPEERADAYSFVSKLIAQGRQAFVVTPLIEESDKLGVKAATTEIENLKKIFPRLKLGLLHGKMAAASKEAAMADFLAGKTQILVSTSVIEVGVDVPNAAAIIIEGAERFGLAQLHQFRGRVGRAEHKSYCFLFTDSSSERAVERLELFSRTSSGFELAELDLKNRGFGNIFGEEQSGHYFKYFDLFDAATARKAGQWAGAILDKDPKLKEHPEMLNKIKDTVIHLE